MASVTISANTVGGVQPNAPTGLTTSTAFDGVQLEWTNPTNSPIDYIQIASSTTNNVAAGFTTVANVKSTAFYDHSTSPGTVYYWVRAVSTLGNIGPWNAADTAGTVGTPQEVTITAAGRQQFITYNGTEWINSAEVAGTSGNAAPTLTREATVTTGSRTAMRVRKTLTSGSRANGDGANQVWSYVDSTGGYDYGGMRFGYSTTGNHNFLVFTSADTSNAFGSANVVINADTDRITTSGVVSMRQATSGAMPTGAAGDLCIVSNNSYKLAYYNGSSWRYVADDTAV